MKYYNIFQTLSINFKMKYYNVFQTLSINFKMKYYKGLCTRFISIDAFTGSFTARITNAFKRTTF